jgi:asparagine synthase (glutamine-hydrolysing)
LPERGAIAATLSGGIDSSAVTALLRTLYPGEITVYSVSFGAEHRNELEFSALVARHCAIEQRIVEVTPARVLEDLDATMAALSEPNGDPLTVPNSQLFRAAAAQSSTVWNGEGGDPCFGGPKNAPMLLAELFGQEPGAERSREQDYLRAHQKCFDELGDMLAPELRADVARSELEALLRPWFADRRWPSFLNKLMAVNVVWKGAHHILPKVDQLSRRFGVSPESPLFDRELVELAFSIPGSLKRRGAEEKYLFKRAVSDVLPRAIVDRPKSGMLVPVEAWFQGPLLPEARSRILDGLRRWQLFDPAWLESLLGGTLAGLRPRRGVKLWLLLALESWLRSLQKG